MSCGRSTTTPNDKTKAELDSAVLRLLSNNFDEDSRRCIVTLLKILDNILQQPYNDKVRSIRLGNPAFSTKVVDKQGHFILIACGFVVTKNNDSEECLVLTEEHEDTPALVHARHLLAHIAIHKLQCPPETLPDFHPPKPRVHLEQTTNASGFTSTQTSTGFDLYKGHRYDGRSAVVGTNLGPPNGWKSKTETQLSQLQQKQAKLEAKLQQEGRGRQRDWTVLSAGQTAASIDRIANITSSTDSKEDAKLLAKHIQKQLKAAQESVNRGFTTKAMRDLERLKNANVYSHTQLAIHMPDGVCVKGNFLPHEAVEAVIDGLKQQVLDDSVPPFELYQTPPRQVLPTNKTLADLSLVPAAKIYLSWKTPWSGKNYIQQQLLQEQQQKSNSKEGPALPKSVPVLKKSNEEDDDEDTKPSAVTSETNKRKKTKAEKEASMLARMIGK
jgi:hypothetical protein